MDTLQRLPLTLEETYQRILRGLEKSHSRRKLKALQWIVHSSQSLQLEELVDALAIDIDADTEPRFDPQRRVNPRNILQICSSLVSITTNVDNGKQYVRLAHFSVEEYLVSESIRNGDAAAYAVDHIHAHTTIIQDCLSYLVYDTFKASSKTEIRMDEDTVLSARLPLFTYARQHWASHARKAREQYQKFASLLMRLFQAPIFEWFFQIPVHNKKESFWLRRAPIENVSQTRVLRATEYRLPYVVRHVLEDGADIEVNDSCIDDGKNPL